MISRSIFSMVTLAMFMLGSHSLFAQDSVKVLLKTSKGEITLELDRAKAPVTSDNFIKYVKDGHYNGTIFHRVIPDFMAQGGGFTADMKEKETRAPIVNEASNGLLNTKYTVAMARTSNPDSATAQFFINVKDNDFLNKAGRNAGYAVFGKVIKGTEVVDEIMKVKTASKGPHDDVPVEPIVIETAEVVEEAAK